MFIRTLDSDGVCNVCHVVDKRHRAINLLKENNYFEGVLSEIIEYKSPKGYNCIVGLSGGADSSYLTVKAKELGLNPLLVYIDNGWNTEVLVSNIQCLIKKLGFELYTIVIDWNEIKDLVRSFL